MSLSAARTATSSALAFHDVRSDDGTHLRAWTNDPNGELDGPTVVLCNGLGTNPYMWPALLRPECGVRVVSWNHRGVGGSQRPRDPRHIEIEHFVADGLSVMDRFGIDHAVLMGWSMGVNTAFELAVRHPERVRGIVAVAGVPGDTFATMLGPLHLPHALARLLTVSACHGLRIGGRLASPVASRLPVGARAVRLLTRTGFMFEPRDPELTAVAIREFLTTPLEWYARLALGTSKHARVSLSAVGVPVAFVAGRWDILAGSRDMASAADRIPGATFLELRGTHFIQLEQPERVHQVLLDFLAEVG